MVSYIEMFGIQQDIDRNLFDRPYSFNTAAYRGDRVLAAAAKCLTYHMIGGEKADIQGLINSNKFLNAWDTGIKQYRPKTYKQKGMTQKNKWRATCTEAWIYFLYDNYGEEHCMRYIKNQIKKHIIKFRYR